MSASDKHSQTDQDYQDAHYHVLGNGPQFLVVRHRHAWHPPTDLMAEQDRLIVRVEVAGMKDGEFHVMFANQQLTISGVRRAPEESPTAYHQMEVRYGEFRTDIILPWQVDANEIVAQYEDGFLRVELPRAKPQKIRVVDVQKPEQE